MMNTRSSLTPDFVKRLPYYEGSKLSLPKFRKFLDVSPDDLGRIVGRTARTVQRLKVPNMAILKRLQPLLYGIALLTEIAEVEEIRAWLHRPLMEWKGKTPMDELVAGNIEGVSNLMRRIRAGETGY